MDTRFTRLFKFSVKLNPAERKVFVQISFRPASFLSLTALSGHLFTTINTEPYTRSRYYYPIPLILASPRQIDYRTEQGHDLYRFSHIKTTIML